MIERLDLDVRKPYPKPDIVELAKKLSGLNGVDGVNISNYERNKDSEQVKIILVGPDLNYGTIKKKLRYHGATVHCVDNVYVKPK